MIDFEGAKITSDTGFLLLREIDERFGILGPIESELEDTRSWVHTNHTLLQMVRQRVRYAQKQENGGFFINVTTVLPTFAPVGLPRDTLLASAEVSHCFSRVPSGSKWRDGDIIVDKAKIRKEEYHVSIYRPVYVR